MHKRSHILGLVGTARSGKDSLYLALKDAGVGVARLAFADNVKRELAQACGVSVPFINYYKERFRPALQWWGTDFRRWNAGEDYWIRQAEHILGAICKTLQPDLVIFTDTRFINEADWIRCHGGQLWRVTRPRTFRQWAGGLFRRAHRSETELRRIRCDREIRNAGTLKDLRASALSAWSEWKAPAHHSI